MYYYNIELFKAYGISKRRNDSGIIYTHINCGKQYFHTMTLEYNLFDNDILDIDTRIESIFKYMMNLKKDNNYTGQGYYMSIKEEYREKRYYYIECDLAGDVTVTRVN